MTFDDLSPYQYGLSFPLSRILNVGWLGPDREYPSGVLPRGFCDTLSDVIAGNAHFDSHFNRIRGVHSCNLCGEQGFVLSNGNAEELLGMSEILIPSSEPNLYFASPSLVHHYIQAGNPPIFNRPSE